MANISLCLRCLFSYIQLFFMFFFNILITNMALIDNSNVFTFIHHALKSIFTFHFSLYKSLIFGINQHISQSNFDMNNLYNTWKYLQNFFPLFSVSIGFGFRFFSFLFYIYNLNKYSQSDIKQDFSLPLTNEYIMNI